MGGDARNSLFEVFMLKTLISSHLFLSASLTFQMTSVRTEIFAELRMRGKNNMDKTA